MKHLISLSFKYLRRQKLRTFLTFMCIMLSVFIMCSVAAYSSSLYTTMKNQAVYEDGSWEVNIGGFFGETVDGSPSEKGLTNMAEAVNIIRNHAAVDDMYITNYMFIVPNKYETEKGTGFFEVGYDENKPVRMREIGINSSAGNYKLLPDKERLKGNVTEKDEINSGYFPEWLKDEYGYKVGDEITITITPVYGEINDNIPEVKAMIDEIRKSNASGGKTVYDDVIRQTIITDYFSEEEEKAVYDSSDDEPDHSTLIMEYLQSYNLNELALYNEKRGEPFTFTMKIAGFKETVDSVNAGSNFNISDYFSERYSLQIETSVTDSNFYSLYNSVTDLKNYYAYNENSALLRISDKIDFDNGLKMLLSDLGFDVAKNFYSYHIHYNDQVLMFELKGADVITGLIGFIVVGIILLFITWLLVRFIIDCAFEVSVKERSAQFAALRVMGASKAQLISLVLTEAFFYSLTAVPIGICAAFSMCKFVFNTLKNSGIVIAEFKVMPFFAVVGIGLSIIAIFISALTSAIWAARKLSPAEAMNYGKLKSKKRKLNVKKSRLKKNSLKFIFSYTMKNIFSLKGRFFMVTATSAVGVMLFMTCAVFAIKFKINIDFEAGYDDFSIDADICDMYDYEKVFGNNEHFSKYKMNYSANFNLENDGSIEIMDKFDDADDHGDVVIRTINRMDYERYAEKLVGMTYDEFVKADGTLVGVSPFADDKGNIQYNEETNEFIRCREDFYQSFSEFGFKEAPKLSFKDSIKTLKIAGKLCCEAFTYKSIYIPLDNTPKFFSAGQFTWGTLLLTVNGSENYEAAINDITEYINSKGITDYKDWYMYGTGRQNFINSIIGIVATFILSIWLGGIFSTISITSSGIINRSRELMMIRAVGMTRKQLIGTIILESVMYAFISTIVGIVSGVALLKFIMGEILGIVFAEEIAVMASVILIITAINLAAALIAALPCIKSFKKNMNQIC